MSQTFQFAFNRQLFFGPGMLGRPELWLPGGLRRIGLLGAPSFLSSPRGEEFLRNLKERGLEVLTEPVHGEPTPESVNRITEIWSSRNPGLILGIGGGSVLDTGKAVAAMVPVRGQVEDYLEGVGTRTPGGETLPYVAVPTTSGTGSEATMNAVVTRIGPGGFKKSLRHRNYIPQAAVLDPELMVGTPWEITAACGMDAFSQLLESFVSLKAGPLSDALAWEGLIRFLENFDLLMGNPGDVTLRGEIALAAYYSGLTLANAGLGVVHGIAGPLGGFYPIPHGAACGTLLHEAFRMTVEKLEGLEESDPCREKMARLGSFLEGQTLGLAEGCSRLLEKMEEWTVRYALPRLSLFGFRQEDIPEVAGASDNKNHPVEFSARDMQDLLKRRL